MRGYNKGGMGGLMRRGMQPPMQMGMNQMGAQDWQSLLAQEARQPGSTDPNMLRVGLGMMGINANSPNSIAPRPGMMGQQPMPRQVPRPQPGFAQPDWQGIFGPSLDRAQVQANQSNQPRQGMMGGGGGGGGLGGLFQNFMQNAARGHFARRR
jgi:hypothetical protein